MDAERASADRSVSLVVPTFREVENIAALVDRVKAVARAHRLNVQMIVVDDRSDDGTVELVRKLADRDWLEILVRDGERSLSLSVLDGFRRARYDTLVVMDADLSHPPEAIPLLLEALHEPDVDFVVGSRFVPDGSIDPRWTMARRLYSYAARLLVRGLTSLRDPTSGFFALRRRCLSSADALTPIGYKIGLELLIKCRCRTVREVPIHFSERFRGTTKLGARQCLQYLRHILRLYVYRVKTRMKSSAE